MKTRRVRVFSTRTCWNCDGRGYVLYADPWDRENGNPCKICKHTGKLAISYLRAKPKKCKCRQGVNECCDICTGTAAYVKKHGHPPKDKQP